MMTDCTIFVIENDAATRDLMQDVLSDEGHMVYCCAWSAATVESVVQMQAQLVIVELNPIEPDTVMLFLMRMRQRDSMRNTCILVTSTSAPLLSRLAAPLRHLGCETLLKPFELEDLLNSVTTLCTGHLPSATAA